jgi:predicted heme/steroid binding protein
MKRLIGLTSAFVFVAAVAFGQDVSYNFDQQADFTKYRTYKWVEVKGGEQLDQLLMQQIRDAFDKNLALKRLAKTDGDNADLYIAFQVAVNQEKQMTTWDTGYGMGPGWGGRWYGGYYRGGTTTSTTSTIYVGSVVLDMYDAAAKKLVWRGVASKQVDTKAKPEKRMKNLDKGAAKMLKNYPPKKES